MDVDTVCTEADLSAFLSGQLTGQARLLPTNATDSTKARQQALDDALRALVRRNPPIREADLAIPAELKQCVLYGAEMWLNYFAISTANDGAVFVFRYKEAKKRFEDEIAGLTPSLVGGLRGNSFGFSVSRR